MMRILPQLFYQSPEVTKIFVDGLSCIVHKELGEAVWHKEGYVSTHAITLVLKGLLQVDGDNGERVQVKANQMIFLPKGLYNISDIIPEKNTTFEAVVFFMDEDLVNDFVTKNNIKPKKDVCASPKIMNYSREVKQYTDALLTIYKGKTIADRNLTRIKLYELLHLITTTETGCFPEALATINNKQRRSLKEFMTANFAKPLSIEDYAYLTGRSIASFRRDFVDHFGISPKQWLIDKRLAKAKELLTRNGTTVSQIALEVGYENFSHFVKAFHKKYGTSPKQFLMKSRKEVLV
jgi:AraC family transcriptional regulator, exoenzyme S synthesis regulatory protein ExsA